MPNNKLQKKNVIYKTDHSLINFTHKELLQIKKLH